jgi:transposase
MQRLPKVFYSPEFRVQAVRLHLEENLTVTEISSRLPLPEGALKNWVAETWQGKLGKSAKAKKPLSDLELELAKLKRELAEVKMERDLLKKCTAYFVRTSA